MTIQEPQHDGLSALDIRRRRALFRATHRGTKEMDWLLGRYAEASLPAMEEPALDEFEQFVSISDPDLNAWILDPATIKDRAFALLVAKLRTFHGLDADDDQAAP